MTGADREYCRSCDYYSKLSNGGAVCDYLLMTGKPRSSICECGVGCTCHSKFEKRRSRKHRKISCLNAIDTAANVGISRNDYTKINKSAAMEMYLDGKNDGEISRAFGCTPSAVRFWRKSYGLKSNCPPGNPNFKKENE